MEKLIYDSFEKIGINLDKVKIDQFSIYFKELINWNHKINLTSITDEKEIVIKHFVDSVSSFKFIHFKNQKVLDMGTGAGFPGLPIKIVFPDIYIVFLDSSNKKLKALDEICKCIGIFNYEIVSENIENFGRNNLYRENFDIVLCRALSTVNTLIEYGIPLLKIGGKLVMYKGPNSLEEVENSINACKELNAKIIENHEIILPFSDYSRRIILVEKLWKTNEKYPRKVGIPKKRPL